MARRSRTQKQLYEICREFGLRLTPGYVEKVIKGETKWVNGVGWRISGERVEAPAERRDSLRAEVDAGELHAASAAMTLANYRAWSYQVATLWEVDSIVRLVESDIRLAGETLGAIICRRGEPAEMKGDHGTE